MLSEILNVLPVRDPFADSRLRRAPYLLVAIPMALLQSILEGLGFLLITHDTGFTPVFPEAGFELVALLLFGLRYWPVVFMTSCLTLMAGGLPWFLAIGISTATLLRALTGVWLAKRVLGHRTFGHFDELVAVVLAGPVASVLSASLGTLSFTLAGVWLRQDWATNWSRGWLEDSLGVLTTAPMLLAAAQFLAHDKLRISARQAVRTALLIACVGSATYVIVFRPEASSLLFFVFGLMLAAAALCGPFAARLAALVITIVIITATHLGVGPFRGTSLHEYLMNLDLFLAATSLTGMALGAFRKSGSLALPGGVLLVGWALSGWLYASMDRDRTTDDLANLDRVIAVVQDRITTRLSAYMDALSGGAGFIAANPGGTPLQWHTYVGNLGLLERYKGTESMSVIQPVRDAELHAFLAEHRDQPGFRLRSANATLGDPPRAEHFILELVEPPSIAARALGMDLATEPIRRSALEQALRSGTPSITSNLVILGQHGLEHGLHLLLPVYRSGVAVHTAA
ncbi:MAG: MASE1 domain-containing protein, partial [Acidobacteriia bacterium]|nr:MASE1 domain-containing protein [Terriglobia bacterium]